MKVGVNTLFLIPGQVGGSETYLRETLRAMVQLADCPDIVLFTNLENDATLRADLEASGKVRFEQLRFHASNRYARILREQFELTSRVKKAGVDLLWSPGYTSPYFCNVPQVVSILDMQYKHHPEDFSASYLMATHCLVSMAARRAKRIIAISKFSKSEVIKYTGQPAEKIDITLLAGDGAYSISASDEKKKEVLGRYGIGAAPYILCVANSYPHKQVHVLVEAFAKIEGELPHRLVILGRARRGEGAVREALARVSDKSRVMRLDYIDRADLPALYQSASLFAFPSVYEGFGLPVLEAMMAGVPVVTTRCGSIPEVGGDAVTYFDSGDSSDLAAKMEGLLGSGAALPEISKRQVQQFSWVSTAKSTLDSLRSSLC